MPGPRILLVNGARPNGNTHNLLRHAEEEIREQGGDPLVISPELVTFDLEGKSHSMWVLPTKKILEEFERAQGIIFGTGTYGLRRSVALQRFLEDADFTYTTAPWRGKPAGIMVSEEKEGGGDIVLSNLKTQINWYGCFLPSQADIKINREALEILSGSGDLAGQEWKNDVWTLDKKWIAPLCASVVAHAGRDIVTVEKSWPRDESEDDWLWVPRPKQPLIIDPVARDPRVLIINGSYHGDSDESNSLSVALHMAHAVKASGGVPEIVSPVEANCAREGEEARYILPVDRIIDRARSAKAIVCISGTHWGEPSSVLSEFLDNVNSHPRRSVFNRKPAAVVVSQQSVNGFYVKNSIEYSLEQIGARVSKNRSMVISQINEARPGRRKNSDEVASLKIIPFLARNLMRAIGDHYSQEVELLARHGRYNGKVWVPAP